MGFFRRFLSVGLGIAAGAFAYKLLKDYNDDGHIDGEYVELTYHLRRVPFDRIRRITGYLVGTLDRFNDGKRAEERDRVKHGMGGNGCE